MFSLKKITTHKHTEAKSNNGIWKQNLSSNLFHCKLLSLTTYWTIQYHCLLCIYCLRNNTHKIIRYRRLTPAVLILSSKLPTLNYRATRAGTPNIKTPSNLQDLIDTSDEWPFYTYSVVRFVVAIREPLFLITHIQYKLELNCLLFRLWARASGVRPTWSEIIFITRL